MRNEVFMGLCKCQRLSNLGFEIETFIYKYLLYYCMTQEVTFCSTDCSLHY